MKRPRVDRDIPACPWPEPREFRPVPGFPGYRIGRDRSVWRDQARPGAPPPWDVNWVRVRLIDRPGLGACVRLRQGGRTFVRAVELLHSAAFAPHTLGCYERERIAPRPPIRRGISRLGVGPGTAAVVAPEPAPPAPIEAPPPAPVAPPPPDLPVGPPPDGRPRGVEYRPVAGFPGYEVGRDFTVWSTHASYRAGDWDGESEIWLPMKVQREGERPRVGLHRAGKTHWFAVLELVRAAFRPVLPEGRPGAQRFARGSAHGRAVLTEDLVAEARRLHRAGSTCAELAKRFGVGKSTLYHAISGRTWSHVRG